MTIGVKATASGGSLTVSSTDILAVSSTGVAVTGVLNATSITGMGSGFQNMEVFTSGTGATWTIPAGVKRFKVTAIGGGGGGGGTSTSAGQVGCGGGSAAVTINFINVVSGNVTYTVGALGGGGTTNGAGTAGGDTTFVYNSITYTAPGGGGGATHSTPNGGGLCTQPTSGTLNLIGNPGYTGGTSASTNSILGMGGNTPLGFGVGGDTNGTATGGAGISGSGYGSGGGGGKNGSGTTARTGGSGTGGLIIFEY